MTNDLASQLSVNPILLTVLLIWSMAWKGLALWRAARYKQNRWFIVILILNTFGLLEIIYLTWFVKKKRFWDKISVKLIWKR